MANVARTSLAAPPLVLFHGVTRRWQSFLPVIPSLAARWQIWGLDFRGHGQSDRAAGAYRVTDYVEDGVALLCNHVGSPAVIYGHSLGSMVAAGVAARLPDRVRALILEDPPFETMGRRITQTPLHPYFCSLRALAGSKRPLPELARAVGELTMADARTGELIPLRETRDAASLRFTASCLALIDPEVLAPIAATEWLEGYDVPGTLRGIRCPMLLLQADPAAGGMLTDDDAAMAETLVADCTRVRMNGAPHLIHSTRTQELLTIVTHFLETLPRPTVGPAPA